MSRLGRALSTFAAVLAFGHLPFTAVTTLARRGEVGGPVAASASERYPVVYSHSPGRKSASAEVATVTIVRYPSIKGFSRAMTGGVELKGAATLVGQDRQIAIRSAPATSVGKAGLTKGGILAPSMRPLTLILLPSLPPRPLATRTPFGSPASQAWLRAEVPMVGPCAGTDSRYFYAALRARHLRRASTPSTVGGASPVQPLPLIATGGSAKSVFVRFNLRRTAEPHLPALGAGHLHVPTLPPGVLRAMHLGAAADRLARFVAVERAKPRDHVRIAVEYRTTSRTRDWGHKQKPNIALRPCGNNAG